MAELKLRNCPFCGGTNITILSKNTNIWRNAFGDCVEYRVFSARCNRCDARGSTAGGQCAPSKKTVKIYGTETLVHSYEYYREKAAEAWNRRADNDRTDDDTAEWIDKEVRGSMTNVCSACGSCSVYPDKYCGGCGRSMKNGY